MPNVSANLPPLRKILLSTVQSKSLDPASLPTMEQPRWTSDRYMAPKGKTRMPKGGFTHLDPANPLYRALDPSIVDSLFGSPLYHFLKKDEVEKALCHLSSAINDGTFDINAPIIGRTYSRYTGYPPLAAAVREANADIVVLLLGQKNIDLAARDHRSQDLIPFRTILMHAVRGAIDHETTDALKKLLKDKRILPSINATAKMSTENQEYTALDFALRGLQYDKTAEPHSSIVKMLKDLGAKESAQFSPHS